MPRGGEPRYTRDELVELYVNQKLSTLTIAEIYGYGSPTTIKKALTRYGIPIRSGGAVTDRRREFYGTLNKGCGDLSGSKWCAIRNGARIRGIPLDITIEFAWNLFVLQRSICALSGVPIKLCPSRSKQLRGEDEQTASLDRIDSSKGYTQDNVQWVHKVIQRMKWQLPDDEFVAWCRIIAGHNGEASVAC